MTDGMIQHTIKPFLDKYLQHDKEFYYEANDVAMDLQKIQNALIDSITRYELFYLKDNGKETNHVLKFSLIGDAKP